MRFGNLDDRQGPDSKGWGYGNEFEIIKRQTFVKLETNMKTLKTGKRYWINFIVDFTTPFDS